MTGPDASTAESRVASSATNATPQRLHVVGGVGDSVVAPGLASHGYVHSVETAGAVDGPGIRYVVFLSGCPLTCAYCHNPDCMKMKRGGRLMDGVELIGDIRSYRQFMLRTNGGVTISGGEPLVQPEFTRFLLESCKAAGLHTALDTSGYLGAKASDELLAATDLVLLDIKSGLPDTYRKTTGVDLQPTIDFAQRLSAMGKPIWIRFVLVPGLTDGEDNMKAVADIVAGLETVERLEILPFHKMGEHKWEALGLPYTLSDTEPPTRDEIARAKAILQASGVPVLV